MRYNHTSGPWRFNSTLREDGSILAMHLETKTPNPLNDPAIFAIREDWVGYMSKSKTGRANARLIAAAPDLKDALIDLIAFLEGNYDHNPVAMAACDKGLAILKRIETP